MNKDYNKKQKMSFLIQEMLSGIFSTEQILMIFEKYPLENLSGEQLADCVDGIIKSATLHIDASMYNRPLIVPAGTGGDMQSTVNITTMTGFVLAASKECKVALYGNRSASGKFGKMDVLEALGIPIDLTFQEIDKSLRENGIAPIFARTVYPGMHFVSEARSQLGKPTFFNIAMPLAAPIIGDTQLLLGVGNSSHLPLLASILKARETRKALLVHNNRDKLDEISFGENTIVLVTKKHRDLYSLATKDFFIQSEDLSLLQASEGYEFVRLFEQTLNPQENSLKIKAIRKVVAMNAACGLYLANEKPGKFLDEFPQYYQEASNILKSGKARDILEAMRRKR